MTLDASWKYWKASCLLRYVHFCMEPRRRQWLFQIEMDRRLLGNHALIAKSQLVAMISFTLLFISLCGSFLFRLLISRRRVEREWGRDIRTSLLVTINKQNLWYPYYVDPVFVGRLTTRPVKVHISRLMAGLCTSPHFLCTGFWPYQEEICPNSASLNVMGFLVLDYAGMGVWR